MKLLLNFFDTPASRALRRQMARRTSELVREICKRGPAPVEPYTPLRFQDNPWWWRRFGGGRDPVVIARSYAATSPDPRIREAATKGE